MDGIDPKDDLLWGFIARALYLGVASFCAFIVISLLCDIFKKILRHYTHGHSRPGHRWQGSYIYFISKLRDSRFLYFLDVYRLVVALEVCILYVYCTYQRNVSDNISVAYRITAGTVSTELLFRVFFSESSISSAFQFSHFVIAFALPSLIIARGENAYLNFAFLLVIPAYYAYIKLEHRLLIHLFNTKRFFLRLAIQFMTLFFTLAAFIQLLEIPGDLLPVEFRERWDPFGDWNFLNAAYFIIVTLSTVGYGDYSPSTVQGRVFTLVIIIVGIVAFTNIVGEIVIQATKGRGSGSFVKPHNSRHVIVTGTPTLTDLTHFVSEFYSDARESNVKAKVVVLIENPPWSDTEWFQHIARNQFLQLRLTFLSGSVRNSADLNRARIASADAVFILTSPSSGEDPSEQDTRTVMNILAIRNIRNDIPIYAQTLLEDTVLQSKVALKTASIGCGEDTNFRHTMDRQATYRGLFHSVLQAEFMKFPKAYLKQGRNCFDDVYNDFCQREDDPGTKAIGGNHTADLLRSQNICLQEMQMALIAGNIKANGVGTLISNMYNDVSDLHASPEDPTWLQEYHMGASCSMTYAVVPEVLDGVAVHEITVDLFHVGVILIATADPRKTSFTPILDTETCLHYGDLALSLTYHDQSHVGIALQIVGLRHATGSLRHQIPLSPFRFGFRRRSTNELQNGSSSMHDRHFGSNSDLRVELPLSIHGAARGHLFLLQRDLQGSADDLETLANDIERSPASRREDMVAPSGMLAGDYSYSVHSLPDHISEHIIISMEGEAPIRSLPLLLRSLWRSDPRESSRCRTKPKVVVIHPDPNDEIRQWFSRFDGLSLFFLKGSPDSRAVWMRANLPKAKAVANLADYTRPPSVTDARTIFTLLTLDVSTRHDQDLFVCSQLVDEKSLEFLREPIHARRIGALLGESSMSMIRDAELDDLLDEEETTNGKSGDTEPQESKPDEVSHAAVTSDSIERNENQETAGREARPSGAENRSRISIKGIFSPPGGSVKSGGSRAGSKSILPSPILSPIPTQAEGIDPFDRPGASRARRGTLFSRSRYAAGELIVQSSAITLLAREYVEPGFIELFANILGTKASCPGLKIRLLSIPASMFSSNSFKRLQTRQRAIRYNVIFNTLIKLGVTPLGIYRSGIAPVLLPSKQRVKRGHCLLPELERLLAQKLENDGVRSTKRQETGIAKVGNALFSFANDLNPAKVKEAQGQAQLHGDTKHSISTSDTSDEELAEQSKRKWNRQSRKTKKDDGRPTADQADEELGEIPPRRSSIELPVRSAGLSKWVSQTSPFNRFLANDDDALEVPGRAKYIEHRNAGNLLPYVYTLPEPNTWCAETDGIFILCNPDFDLPPSWTELGTN